METNILIIGSKKIQVRDISDASRIYSIARYESGEGASTFPNGKITIGKKKYRISYNGRVWDGDTCIMEAQ